MFLLVSLSKIKIFHSCRTRVVCVALVSHSCRPCSTCVALVSHLCLICVVRVALVLLVSDIRAVN